MLSYKTSSWKCFCFKLIQNSVFKLTLTLWPTNLLQTFSAIQRCSVRVVDAQQRLRTRRRRRRRGGCQPDGRHHRLITMTTQGSKSGSSSNDVIVLSWHSYLCQKLSYYYHINYWYSITRKCTSVRTEVKTRCSLQWKHINLGWLLFAVFLYFALAILEQYKFYWHLFVGRAYMISSVILVLKSPLSRF